MKNVKLKMQNVVSNSERETFVFAKRFARTLRGGEVVALIGELGSGKTTFVRGFARAFSICQPIGACGNRIRMIR